MSKKDKKQNTELIEKLNEIQSQLNEVKSEAGVEVEGDIVFTREQLENFLIEYTNKINDYIFDEMFLKLDSDSVVSFNIDGREITSSIDEDALRDFFIEATASVETDVMMEYADELIEEIGII